MPCVLVYTEAEKLEGNDPCGKNVMIQYLITS